ncbi:unnamed protein product [Periconia digitata]|uniref:Uncharacterized protein n=1 Tax=Periconia digitata TaxID=1303443 RepID=A0A9W4UP28_9PLEO|nr:unnamed protein product [Periconia digitata]
MNRSWDESQEVLRAFSNDNTTLHLNMKWIPDSRNTVTLGKRRRAPGQPAKAIVVAHTCGCSRKRRLRTSHSLSDKCGSVHVPEDNHLPGGHHVRNCKGRFEFGIPLIRPKDFMYESLFFHQLKDSMSGPGCFYCLRSDRSN